MLSCFGSLNTRVLKIVESVLQQSSRAKPADAVLRAQLKRQSGLSPELAATAARAVFAWFRWRGWLDETQPFADQVQKALLLQERFDAAPESFSNDELVARAVPQWVSKQMDIRPAWVRALQRAPRLWLRARSGQGKALAARLGHCWIPDDRVLADSLEYRGREDLFRTREFHAGEFEVQDLSSQIVGLACAPKPGETWWDACAGEGGKTLHLSDLMQNKGLIWASDRAEWRFETAGWQPQERGLSTTGLSPGRAGRSFRPEPGLTECCSTPLAADWGHGSETRTRAGPLALKMWKNWPRHRSSCFGISPNP